MAINGSSFANENDPQAYAAPAEDLSSSFRVKSERFSTSGLAKDDRVEKWEDHNAKALVGLSARTINDSPLEATEINLHLPSLHFAHVDASAHIIERTSDHIRSKPADSVVLYFALFGEAFFYHPDGVRTLAPGSVLIYDTDKPFMRGFAKGLKELVLMVPRQLFNETTDGGLPSGGEPRVLSFGKSNKANDFATAIAETMATAMNDVDAQTHESIEDSVLDLLRGVFSGTTASDASSQFRAVLAFIDRHLRNPDLSAFMISNALGISTRQLSRIFSQQDASLPSVVLVKRLELARRVLQSPKSSHSLVTNVASYSGFNSHAHFSRVFKNHFGYSPLEVRTFANNSVDQF